MPSKPCTRTVQGKLGHCTLLNMRISVCYLLSIIHCLCRPLLGSGKACFAFLCRASPVPERFRASSTTTLFLICGFLCVIYCLLSTVCVALAEEQNPEELNQALAHIKESYYGTVDVGSLAGSSLQAVVDSLDKDSRLVEGEMPSLGFVRGLEGEASIAEARLITPNTGYIKIGFFGRRTGVHFQKALETLGAVARLNSASLPLDASPFPLPPGEDVVGGSPPEAGTTLEPGIKGLLLDLRDNPGGHLKGALGVLELFLPSGRALLIEKTRGGERVYLSEGGAAGARYLPRVDAIPIVILINGSTASSAEVVTATLRHHCRARVVGEKSKGKGTIQEVIPLGTRVLILTVGEYLLPDGSSLKDEGIVPDLEVKGYEEQLRAALSLLTASQ